MAAVDTAAPAPVALRQVPYVNLPAQFAEERLVLMPAIEGVFARGDFIGGAAIGQFELAFADYVGVKHAIGMNSGTDALMVGMAALGIGPGDEVITPPNSFVASTAAIVRIGAKPVFADVLPDQNIDPAAVERAVTSRTRAIMPVHLTGRVADMDRINAIAKANDLWVIEDAAQAVGSTLHGQKSGAFGTIGCFSAHPLKNMNAAGDAGILVTNDDDVAARVRLMINHGLLDRETVTLFGTVSRLDTLQAAILSKRLERLPSVIDRRRNNAALYRELLAGTPVFIPACRQAEFNTFHTFVVQTDRRDELRDYLAACGVMTAIHYPVPIHLQPAARSLGHEAGDFPVTEQQAKGILSLPIHQFLSEDDIRHVCAAIRSFYGQ